MKQVIVIGSGIVGASVAAALAREGCAVSVIEARAAGGIASAASFGWLNASFHLDEAHFRLRHAAMAVHRRWQSWVPGFHDWPGCLWFEDPDPAAQEKFASGLQTLGYATRVLGASAVRQGWPHLRGVDRAVFLPEEGVVETASLARALLRQAGVRLMAGLAVTGLVAARGRVTAVRTAAGDLAADHVVLAAGVGSAGLLAPLGLRLPMLSRPGVMLVSRPVARVLPGLLCGPMGEVRQRPDGRLLMPTSPGHQGDATEVLKEDPEALAEAALSRLARHLPDIRAEIEAILAADRPVPSDGAPVLGTIHPGLTLAVMHSGATLAPLAGEAVADLLLRGSCDPLWQPYGPERFQG